LRAPEREQQGDSFIMRKVFGGAMIFSIVGAIVLGGALAWNSSKTQGPFPVSVGTLSWQFFYGQDPSAELGPDGNITRVGQGWIENDGDFQIALNDPNPGSVFIQNVSPGHDNCNVNNFFGGLNSDQKGDTHPVDSGTVGPHGNKTGGDFWVDIGVAANAPTACIGATISYTVTVNIHTISPNPPPPPTS
jgi:hypothetical protein